MYQHSIIGNLVFVSMETDSLDYSFYKYYLKNDSESLLLSCSFSVWFTNTIEL